jgi:large subunit ribosomal protein L29
MKAAKLREMSTEELEDQLDQLHTELFNLRVQNTTKELKDTSRLRQTRRDIGRVLTILNARRHEQQAAG